jgi:hypothetical protein
MDPADGARYAIPFVLVTAFFASVGLVSVARRLPLPVALLPALFAAGSLVYVSSLLYQRSTSASPPVRAIQHARRSFPKGAVAIYELPLWPHATYFLGDYAPRTLDDAMAAFYDRPDVPLFILADGASSEVGAATFSWTPSDAYSKLTRNHYRVASIIPVPPERRFLALRGVYGPEREPEGLAWRWLAPAAALQLPAGGDRLVTVRLGLPADSSLESNDVSIAADGGPARAYRVARGKETVVDVAVSAGAPVLTFASLRSVVPSEVPGSLSRDGRRLSVKMFGLSTRAAAAPAATPAGSTPGGPRATRPRPDRGSGPAADPSRR